MQNNPIVKNRQRVTLPGLGRMIRIERTLQGGSVIVTFRKPRTSRVFISGIGEMIRRERSLPGGASFVEYCTPEQTRRIDPASPEAPAPHAMNLVLAAD
jgi:hypothetical protein